MDFIWGMITGALVVVIIQLIIGAIIFIKKITGRD